MNNNDILLHKWNNADECFESITKQLESTLTDSDNIALSSGVYDYALSQKPYEWSNIFSNKLTIGDYDLFLIEDYSGSEKLEKKHISGAVLKSTFGFNPPAKTKYVSSAFSGLSNPYYTSIQNAINNASSGDLIIVYPGEYNERLTLSTGVNLYLHNNVVIKPSTDSSTAIIYGDGVTCSIFGYGFLTHTATSYTPNLIHLINYSTVYCEFKNIAGVNTGGIVIEDSTQFHLFVFHACDKIVNAKGTSKVILKGSNYDILKTEESAELYADIKRFEKAQNYGGTMKVVFSETTETNENAIYVQGSSNSEFIDGYIYHNSDSYSAVRNNGKNSKLRLKHIQIKEEKTASCLDLDAGVNIADNCCLVTNGTYSVNGTYSAELKNWGSVANKDKSSNITVLIENLLVDTEVE